jgi:hypothetical protein
MSPWKPHKSLIYLWLFALLTWWLRYHPLGFEGLVFDEDARQHVYWTARFQDPALFPNDLITDFASSTKIAPWGYQLIYRLGTHFMAPLPFSQLLSLGLLNLPMAKAMGFQTPPCGGPRGSFRPRQRVCSLPR